MANPLAMALGVKPGGKLTKASIKIAGGAALTCYMNPESFSVTRSISYGPPSPPTAAEGVPPQPAPNGITNKMDVPNLVYGGCTGETTSIKLLFDSTMEKGLKKSDVRSIYTNKLDKATRKEAANKEPPKVTFSWGTYAFEGVITNLVTEFVLFDDTGTPLRAWVTISLSKTSSGTQPRQNPTSGGIPGDIHVFQQGDRLDLLAAKYLEKPNAWREIAEYNGIDNPRRLVPGRRLLIPPMG